MRLLRLSQPFDHPYFIYEIKLDGFRGPAVVDGAGCELISRNGHTFTQWESLKREIARSLRCRSAVLDGEIACLDADGRSNFYPLPFRASRPVLLH
jgi:bifunctional non-homologous end joining protein LigD